LGGLFILKSDSLPKNMQLTQQTPSGVEFDRIGHRDRIRRRIIPVLWEGSSLLVPILDRCLWFWYD